jgi:predicted RNA binding protein YcfA (HicA-like mRNA interferase family)
MPRPAKHRHLIRALEKLGFELASQRGSHMKYKRATRAGELVVIVPNYEEISEGTVNSILRQARVTREQLDELL